jgi:hypothetical protein
MVNVHRFHDSAGVYVSDNGGTAYLTAAECRALAAALNRVAHSIAHESFGESSGLDFSINDSSRIPDPPQFARRLEDRRTAERARYRNG